MLLSTCVIHTYPNCIFFSFNIYILSIFSYSQAPTPASLNPHEENTKLRKNSTSDRNRREKKQLSHVNDIA
jgi:hypothetical protein